MSADALIRKARSLRLQAGRSAPLAARQLTVLAESYEAEAQQIALLAVATRIAPSPRLPA